VQSNDSYLVDETEGSIDQHFKLQRFNLANQLDPSFNGVEIGFDGTNTRNASQDYAHLVQPDGSIVVAGRLLVSPDQAFGLARMLSNGTLDPTFGSEGSLTTLFPGDSSRATAITLQADGNIVAAGTADGAATTYLAVARYLGN